MKIKRILITIVILSILGAGLFFFYYKMTENVIPIEMDPNTMRYLQPLKKGIVSSTTLTVTNEHQILELDNKSGINDKSKIPYTSRIYTELANEKMYIYFTKQNTLITQILVPTASGYKKGSLSDLKVGDKILIEIVYSYDLKGPRRVSKILSRKITKVR